jgi:hypothetical protein
MSDTRRYRNLSGRVRARLYAKSHKIPSVAPGTALWESVPQEIEPLRRPSLPEADKRRRLEAELRALAGTASRFDRAVLASPSRELSIDQRMNELTARLSRLTAASERRDNEEN